MSQIFTLAHLSDVHLAPLVGFAPGSWGVKRFTGYVNWHLRRARVHLRGVVDRIVADMLAMKPDHIVVTGDLANIGLPLELERAREWLAGLGPPERVTVIPGNHDIYARVGRDSGVARWKDYMVSNAQGAAFVSAHAAAEPCFPFVRRLGDIALIGVNSAVPTPPLLATGIVGGEQLERLGAILDRLREADLMRIVLIHHPPLPGQASRTRGLVDAEAMAETLARHGAELVLHGHNHRNMLAWCTGSAADIPVIGVASASIGRPHGEEPLGRYNLYRIGARQGRPHIEMIGRGLARPDGEVVELDRRWIGAARAPAQA
jgi:3',5'-cyclic AMP phosphodiesterase CpdA